MMEYLERLEDYGSLSQHYLRIIEKEFNDEISFKIKYKIVIAPPVDKYSREHIWIHFATLDIFYKKLLVDRFGLFRSYEDRFYVSPSDIKSLERSINRFVGKSEQKFTTGSLLIFFENFNKEHPETVQDYIYQKRKEGIINENKKIV